MWRRATPAAALESLPGRGKQSPAFKQFFESNLCDDFLCAALDHFAALLRLEDMVNARTVGKKPQDVQPPSNEERQAAALLDQTVKEVATYYCYTIMQFSRYEAAQQDRIFFESFYEFTASVVCAAFPAQHRYKIEDELGRLTRTDTFNQSKRKNDSNHHTKMYFTSRELYVLRHAGDGFMGKRILTGFLRRAFFCCVDCCSRSAKSLTDSSDPTPLAPGCPSLGSAASAEASHRLCEFDNTKALARGHRPFAFAAGGGQAGQSLATLWCCLCAISEYRDLDCPCSSTL